MWFLIWIYLLQNVSREWPALRPYWPRNDLAVLTFWRRHCLESRKVRSLDRSCFSSTLPTCCSSSKVIISRHTRMQTTRRLWTLSAVWRWRSRSACHCLHRRDFSVDEGKSTAAESLQDRGPLVRLISTSTLGPYRICSGRWCFGVTGHRCSGPWCLHRQWCHHEDPRHQHLSSVFFGTAPDMECATLPATAHTANIGPCIGHYQAGPLQLGPSRYCWLPAKPGAVLVLHKETVQCILCCSFLSLGQQCTVLVLHRDSTMHSVQ